MSGRRLEARLCFFSPGNRAAIPLPLLAARLLAPDRPPVRAPHDDDGILQVFIYSYGLCSHVRGPPDPVPPSSHILP